MALDKSYYNDPRALKELNQLNKVWSRADAYNQIIASSQPLSNSQKVEVKKWVNSHNFTQNEINQVINNKFGQNHRITLKNAQVQLYNNLEKAPYNTKDYSKSDVLNEADKWMKGYKIKTSDIPKILEGKFDITAFTKEHALFAVSKRNDLTGQVKQDVVNFINNMQFTPDLVNRVKNGTFNLTIKTTQKASSTKSQDIQTLKKYGIKDPNTINDVLNYYNNHIFFGGDKKYSNFENFVRNYVVPTDGRPSIISNGKVSKNASRNISNYENTVRAQSQIKYNSQLEEKQKELDNRYDNYIKDGKGNQNSIISQIKRQYPTSDPYVVYKYLKQLKDLTNQWIKYMDDGTERFAMFFKHQVRSSKNHNPQAAKQLEPKIQQIQQLLSEGCKNPEKDLDLDNFRNIAESHGTPTYYKHGRSYAEAKSRWSKHAMDQQDSIVKGSVEFVLESMMLSGAGKIFNAAGNVIKGTKYGKRASRIFNIAERRYDRFLDKAGATRVDKFFLKTAPKAAISTIPQLPKIVARQEIAEDMAHKAVDLLPISENRKEFAHKLASDAAGAVAFKDKWFGIIGGGFDTFNELTEANIPEGWKYALIGAAQPMVNFDKTVKQVYESIYKKEFLPSQYKNILSKTRYGMYPLINGATWGGIHAITEGNPLLGNILSYTIQPAVGHHITKGSHNLAVNVSFGASEGTNNHMQLLPNIVAKTNIFNLTGSERVLKFKKPKVEYKKKNGKYVLDENGNKVISKVTFGKMGSFTVDYEGLKRNKNVAKVIHELYPEYRNYKGRKLEEKLIEDHFLYTDKDGNRLLRLPYNGAYPGTYLLKVKTSFQYDKLSKEQIHELLPEYSNLEGEELKNALIRDGHLKANSKTLSVYTDKPPLHYPNLVNDLPVMVMNYNECVKAAQKGHDLRAVAKVLSETGEIVNFKDLYDIKRIKNRPKGNSTSSELLERAAYDFVAAQKDRYPEDLIHEMGVELVMSKNVQRRLDTAMVKNEQGEIKQYDPNTGEIYYSKDLKMFSIVADQRLKRISKRENAVVNTNGEQAIFLVGENNKIYRLSIDVNGPGSAGKHYAKQNSLMGKLKAWATSYGANFLQTAMPPSATIDLIEVTTPSDVYGKAYNTKNTKIKYFIDNSDISIKMNERLLESTEATENGQFEGMLKNQIRNSLRKYGEIKSLNTAATAFKDIVNKQASKINKKIKEKREELINEGVVSKDELDSRLKAYEAQLYKELKDTFSEFFIFDKNKWAGVWNKTIKPELQNVKSKKVANKYSSTQDWSSLTPQQKAKRALDNLRLLSTWGVITKNVFSSSNSITESQFDHMLNIIINNHKSGRAYKRDIKNPRSKHIKRHLDSSR